MSASISCQTREKRAFPNCAKPASCASKLCRTRKLHFQIVPSSREAGAFQLCPTREKPALPTCAQPTRHFQIVPNPRAALPNCAQRGRSGHFQTERVWQSLEFLLRGLSTIWKCSVASPRRQTTTPRRLRRHVVQRVSNQLSMRDD